MRKHNAILSAILLFAFAVAGCNSSAGGKPISKDQESAMRRPPGSVPMPKEAAEAMKRANQPPPSGKVEQ